MKILIVSSYLPYPLHSGGQVRLYNLIKELSDKHEITLVCEKRPTQTQDDILEMEKICHKVVTVDRRKQWSIKNIAKTASSFHSFLFNGHTHPEMKQLIMDELVRETFDLIHVETFYVLQNVPETSLPLVLVDHNIEYMVYQRFVDRAPAVVRPLLALDVLKIKREEEQAWTRATRLVAVSQDDRKVMEEKDLKSQIVSNGVNVEEFAYKEKGVRKDPSAGSGQGKKILFIGDFKWIQNQDTAQFLIKEVWPKLDLPFAVKLWFVGRHIPVTIKTLTDDPDVLFDEKSSEKPTPEIFQEADILLAPIRIGGGTSYKILEAMSCGTPVVTMKLSADAIKARDGEEIMIGDTPEEIVNKTQKLLTDALFYKKIAKNGRILIEEKYSWKKIAKDLETVYKGVVS